VFMRWVADALYLLAGLLYLPALAYQIIVLKKNRRGWSERLGLRVRARDSRPRLWIHAVSLGEVNCTPKFVAALRDELPEWDVVVSSTTDTGYARAVSLYGREHVFRFPLDLSWIMGRVFDRVRPSILVLVELEVWFNLVRLARRRGVPVVVVNGRLTERSARRFQRLGSPVRRMFADLAWVGAQDDAIAERFCRLGAAASRIEVTSSLKWDTAEIVDQVEGAVSLADALGLERSGPLWVAGSTGPDEEEMVLGAHAQLVREWSGMAQNVPANPLTGRARGAPGLAIVPRKPERFAEVARLIERQGFRCVRRSECPDSPSPSHELGDAVILGDTMGELRKFYSLADVVFVGRSLVPLGGSDPIEVAALGKPIVVGPYTVNFAMPVAALRAAGAVCEVQRAADLVGAVRGLLRDTEGARDMGLKAREVVRRHQGATHRTANRVAELARSAIRRPVPVSSASEPAEPRASALADPRRLKPAARPEARRAVDSVQKRPDPDNAGLETEGKAR